MVDPEARVALPAAGRIVPEGVDGAVRMAGADGVGPAEWRIRRKAARLSGCISASWAMARTEKTSSWLSVGMTFQSPARTTGFSSSSSSRECARSRSIQASL
jgi:hypothetical protein